MHALFSQFSGLVGLFVFLTRTWNLAPVEEALLAGIGSALAVYALVSLADFGVRRILSSAPDANGQATPPAAEKATIGSSAPDFEAAALATAAA